MTQLLLRACTVHLLHADLLMLRKSLLRPLLLQLYAMLDHACSCFTAFVGSYAEAGGDALQPLVNNCMKGPERILRARVQALKQELQAAKKQAMTADKLAREKTVELARVQAELKQLYKTNSLTTCGTLPTLRMLVLSPQKAA